MGSDDCTSLEEEETIQAANTVKRTMTGGGRFRSVPLVLLLSVTAVSSISAGAVGDSSSSLTSSVEAAVDVAVDGGIVHHHQQQNEQYLVARDEKNATASSSSSSSGGEEEAVVAENESPVAPEQQPQLREDDDDGEEEEGERQGDESYWVNGNVFEDDDDEREIEAEQEDREDESLEYEEEEDWEEEEEEDWEYDDDEEEEEEEDLDETAAEGDTTVADTPLQGEEADADGDDLGSDLGVPQRFRGRKFEREARQRLSDARTYVQGVVMADGKYAKVRKLCKNKNEMCR